MSNFAVTVICTGCVKKQDHRCADDGRYKIFGYPENGVINFGNPLTENDLATAVMYLKGDVN